MKNKLELFFPDYLNTTKLVLRPNSGVHLELLCDIFDGLKVRSTDFLSISGKMVEKHLSSLIKEFSPYVFWHESEKYHSQLRIDMKNPVSIIFNFLEKLEQLELISFRVWIYSSPSCKGPMYLRAKTPWQEILNLGALFYTGLYLSLYPKTGKLKI